MYFANDLQTEIEASFNNHIEWTFHILRQKKDWVGGSGTQYEEWSSMFLATLLKWYTCLYCCTVFARCARHSPHSVG